MPQYALAKSPTGQKINAKNVTIGQKHSWTFYCCTSRCNAEMIGVNIGDVERAFFRSKNKKDHINFDCIKNAIVFDESKYVESKFSIDFAFESMIGKNHSIETVIRDNKGTKTGKVGCGRGLRIHTLPLLYAMCIKKGKNGRYNGLLVDDILVDGENYDRYKKGIHGYKIIETSCYYDVNGEKSFIMNYPLNYKNEHKLVKINFMSDSLFFKYRSKLKDTNHIQPVIIAGEWSAVSNQNYICECNIYKSTQLYFATDIDE